MRVFRTIRDDTCAILTICIRILQFAVLAFNAALIVVVDAGRAIDCAFIGRTR